MLKTDRLISGHYASTADTWQRQNNQESQEDTQGLLLIIVVSVNAKSYFKILLSHQSSL